MANASEKAVTSVLLATHLEPIIHGQALVGSLLAKQSGDWDEPKLISLNTAYAETREQLRGGSLAKIRKAFGYGRQMADLIRQHRASALLVTPAFFRGPFFKDFLLITWLKWRTGVRVIGWVHMAPDRLGFESFPKPVRSLVKWLLRQVDLWVACSPSLLKTWPDWLLECAGSRLAAVPNGINDPAPELDQVSVERSSASCRVVFLSAIDREKGWHDLFAVACELCADNPDCVFDFFGGLGANEKEEDVRKRFAESGFQDQIVWHGPAWGEDKQRALQKADLFVFPSYTEQFPLAVLEAMAFGLPIISTDVGAVCDALPGQTLLKPGDQRSLRAEIQSLIANPQRRREQGLQNRKRFVDQFTSQAFSVNWQSLLDQFLT